MILKSRRAFGKRVLNVMRGHVFIIYTLCEGALKKKKKRKKRLWQAVCLDSLGDPNNFVLRAVYSRDFKVISDKILSYSALLRHPSF